MRFFSSRTVTGCGIQEDGDRLEIAILLVREKTRPGRHKVCIEGVVGATMTIELTADHKPGRHYGTKVRRVDVPV
ncbi:hypothetical protein [Leptolyngbya sp. FACHB-16]|uniref:hypothetical protein n=1 Tax=unclassified Leptolyngbya TaxID=2650499 RepID=UPI001A7EC979|nr:hypothetical protein [Leptolyngbya sp. FACHB-16]